MVETILPSYLYQQYNNDPDLMAFFDAYNTISQGYLDNINSLDLPIYTKQTNRLLDLVGNGIYGISRPYIPFGTSTLAGGVYNSLAFVGSQAYGSYDTLPYDQGLVSIQGIPLTSLTWASTDGGTVTGTTATTPVGVTIGSSYLATITGVVPVGYNGTFQLTQTGTTTFTYSLPVNPGTVTTLGQVGSTVSFANDDIYQRTLTWNLYKGDGTQFNTRWLKNRVYRFLTQTHGIPAPIPFPSTAAQAVGVTFDSNNTVIITVGSGINTYASILSALINNGTLQLPFQYTFSVSY
jgi:hypothetical protein